jgi:hypothetical protein
MRKLLIATVLLVCVTGTADAGGGFGSEGFQGFPMFDRPMFFGGHGFPPSQGNNKLFDAKHVSTTSQGVNQTTIHKDR